MRSRIYPVFLAVIVLAFVLTACGGKAPAGATPALPAIEGGTSNQAPAHANPATPTAASGTGAKAPATANPALPAAEGGGGSETASGPSLTNPGGLPAAPSSGESGSNNSQSGEERMVKTEDPAGLFTILFVDTWTQAPGSTPGTLRSSQQQWYAEAGVVTAQGMTPMQAAQALNASQANTAAGYQKLVLQNGNVHGLPAASLIYQYETGTNPVTGKALKYIASQVFIGSGPAGKLGHVTFAAPYAYYGDLSGIFDTVLAGFSWK